MNGWQAIDPRSRLLELRGDTEQHVLAAVGARQLYADRQVVGVPVQRQGDRGLAGHVRERGVRHECRGAHEAEQRLVGCAERAELHRRLAQRGRQQEVVARRVPAFDLASELEYGMLRVDVVGRGDRTAELS